MSDSKSSPDGSDGKTAKRSLPSWMSSRQDTSGSLDKKTAGSEENKDNEQTSRMKSEVKNFSKLLVRHVLLILHVTLSFLGWS